MDQTEFALGQSSLAEFMPTHEATDGGELIGSLGRSLAAVGDVALSADIPLEQGECLTVGHGESPQSCDRGLLG